MNLRMDEQKWYDAEAAVTFPAFLPKARDTMRSHEAGLLARPTQISFPVRLNRSSG